MVSGFNNKNCPCHGCEERNVTLTFNCHTDCERYNTWRNNLRKNKANYRKQIDPSGCGYFKENRKSSTASMSKCRYR